MKKWTPVFSPRILAVVCCALAAVTLAQASKCGGTVEGTRGTIQSPNFPKPFPIPISCRWIIHAPEKSKIVIYFTQYYLRRSLFITEYDSYESPTVNENANVLGEIDTEDQITSLVAYRPYVILDLRVTDGKNLNLRVEEYLADVHGFNITWLIVPREQPVKTDTCSVHECSFLGNCMVSADYSNYTCECFEKFYGRNCQKGPFCDWEKGINMCLNGGRCRYFLGSLVNICDCPEGYEGVRCETRLEEEQFDKECVALQCSHHCEVSQKTGILQCACEEGFSLNEDGVTCFEREQYRIAVHMPVKNQTHLDDNIMELLDDLALVASRGTLFLQLSGVTTAQDFTVDSVSSSSVNIHFYVDKTELALVARTTFNLIRGDQFFGIRVHKEDIVVTSNPRLKLLGLENSDAGPAREGKLLTLSCIARGSEAVEFRWFKDGLPFNLSLTNRNAWEIRLPETMEEKHISVLSIDGVTIYDKGVFTCEIRDFNRAINRSLSVDVLPYPHVEVMPLTISALKGRTYSFRCFSPDEKKRSFTYKWIKNNRPIDDADQEKIEDLMPSGSRLLIRNAKVNNNYSCIVTNKAGTSSKTVYIFVADASNSSLACPSTTLQGIRWNRTFGGHFSLRKCPTDAKDFNARGMGDGLTKRRCTCQVNSCKWLKPSYTGCQSVHLINLYDQLRKVQLGYQESQLTNVYKTLCQIASRARGRMYAGDLDITAQSLLMVLTTARDFPSLVTERFNSHAVVDFMVILLEETLNLTQDEKEEIRAGGHILQMSEVLIELQEEQLITLDAVQNRPINLKIEQFYKTVYNNMLLKSSHRKNISIIIKKKQAVQQRVRREELKGKEEYSENTNTGYKVLKLQYDQSLLQVLDIKKRKLVENELFVSNVFSYLPLGYSWHKNKNFYMIDIPHIQDKKKYPKQMRKAHCLSWERIDREESEGVWKQDSCILVTSDTNKTKCACPLPGHFTVVLIPENSTSVLSDSTASNLILLVAVGISIYLTFIAVCSYLIAWRYLQTVRHCIFFNFILSVFGVNVTCLMCLLKPDIEVFCMFGTILLQLFVVAAFTFLLLDAVKLCNEIYAQNHPIAENEFWKYIFIGWGVPIFSVICMLFMISLVGFMEECHDWCWWQESHPHFYAVLIPVFILFIAHITVLIFCLVMMRKWNNQWRFILRKRVLLEIGRNKLLLILLVIFAAAGVKTSSNNSLGSQIFFLIFDVVLAFVIMLLLCIMNKAVRQSVRNCRNSSQNSDISTFRGIMPCGDHLEYSRAEAERMHEYCSRVDRERYTNKHKRKLRVLLNSSSSSGSSGPTCGAMTGAQLQRENWSSALRKVPSKIKDRKTNNVDSGISEGTESEKSLTPPNVDFTSEFQGVLNPPCKPDIVQRQVRPKGQRKPPKVRETGAPVARKSIAKSNKEKVPTSTSTQEQFDIESDYSQNSKSFLLDRRKNHGNEHQSIGNNDETAVDNMSLSLLPCHIDKELRTETQRLERGFFEGQKEELDTTC